MMIDELDDDDPGLPDVERERVEYRLLGPLDVDHEQVETYLDVRANEETFERKLLHTDPFTRMESLRRIDLIPHVDPIASTGREPLPEVELHNADFPAHCAACNLHVLVRCMPPGACTGIPRHRLDVETSPT